MVGFEPVPINGGEALPAQTQLVHPTLDPLAAVRILVEIDDYDSHGPSLELNAAEARRLALAQ